MRAIMSCLALAALAACNRAPSVEMHNASVNEVAAKVKAATAGGTELFVRPGKWQTSMTIDSMDAPGMPPEAAAKMKEMGAQSRVIDSCLTPEQARKPTPDLFLGDKNRCRYDDFTMKGGKIDMTMRCDAPGPNGTMTQVMTMSGTYAPDAYHMAMSSTTDTGSAGVGKMTMKLHLDSRRLGDCDAKK